MSVLLCTLGTSWAVIPEVYALLMPEVCPLYAAHPGPAQALRENLQHPHIDEVWVVTTVGRQDIGTLTAWWAKMGSPGRLRIWESSAGDAGAQSEVELIRELILRASLRAGPSAVLSLTGGRKTMSADLQRAGMAFGCAAMLHVLPPELARPDLDRLNKADFVSPLPLDLAAGIQPVLVGIGHANDLLGIDLAITTERFPLPEEGIWTGPGDKIWLWKTLDERERDGSRLLANYHKDVAKAEAHENWRSLYRLPPATIARLRSTRLTEAHRLWLARLPKAELHCHLGGILDLDEQIAVGKAVWAEVPDHQRDQARQHARAWMAMTNTSGGDRWTCSGTQRAQVAAAILAETDRAVLEEALWPVATERFALKSTHPWGFKAYEHPGSLVGSAILQTPVATWATARAVRARCRLDGLTYLELRCSPKNYHDGFLAELHQALAHEHRTGDALIRIIVIADRRKGKLITEVVSLALNARQQLGDFVVGIDLAGDEKEGDPQVLAPLFHQAFEACLRVTIHAGEGEAAANIWKSAYHLHADRIGHGLTLADAPDLAARFRDRRICLELCPTSNHEVVGYGQPGYANYPLRQLMNLGVPLTLCTDNPGISRTTLTDEYVRAGLTQWEALAIMKQGFLHSFLPASERERLIKDCDQLIFNHISEKS
jgi:adenosine deaminase